MSWEALTAIAVVIVAAILLTAWTTHHNIKTQLTRAYAGRYPPVSLRNLVPILLVGAALLVFLLWWFLGEVLPAVLQEELSAVP